MGEQDMTVRTPSSEHNCLTDKLFLESIIRLTLSVLQADPIRCSFMSESVTRYALYTTDYKVLSDAAKYK